MVAIDIKWILELRRFQANIGIGTSDFTPPCPLKNRIEPFRSRIVNVRQSLVLLFVGTSQINFFYVRHFSMAFAEFGWIAAEKLFSVTNIHRQPSRKKYFSKNSYFIVLGFKAKL